MKTPLATLRMRLERLGQRADCQGIQDDLDALLHVVEELHARLRDMVDFVKLEIAAEPADLNLSVAGALRHFEAHRKPKTRIELRMAPKPMVFPHSAAAIELAIENLLANAQEAAKDQIEVVVETQVDSQRRQAVITVTDDGPGIPMEVRDDIFRRPLNSTKPGGSGLGAALVKYIVDQHHGSLTWQSPAAPRAHGVRVTIRLPLVGEETEGKQG
jgi:signal transduction histidine kinase